MNTNIAMEMPEDVARVLRGKWGDLSQHTVETLAIEGYRTSALSTAQIRRMLGFQTRMEVDAFLRLHGVYRDYTEADLDRDIRTLRQLQRDALCASSIATPWWNEPPH
jgi:hypothetical protein